MDDTTIATELARAAAEDSRELDQICDAIALALIDNGTEPPFQVDSADFATDAFLICSDRYWFHRFQASPTIETAAQCARWINGYVSAEVRNEVIEKWALGYSFVTKDSVESRRELAEASERVVGEDNSAGDVAHFATLYHAGKLRANFAYDELHRFLESSLIAMAAGTRHRASALFGALQAFAAFGSRSFTSEYAMSLFRRAWNSPDRTRHVTDVCLNGLDVATPFDAQGQILREHASRAVEERPDDHMFHFRLASGLHVSGHDDDALTSINTALELLPAVGKRVSHRDLQQQYLGKRDDIIEGQLRARWIAEQQRGWEQHQEEIAELRTTLQSSTVRAVELVAVFTAAIAFAIGSLQITLSSSLGIDDRLWLLAALGGGLLLFAALIIGGTWFITRTRHDTRGGSVRR